ncbi:MAG: hypothetical protein J5737_02895 [Bacteroidales bacterium]|nr:hypothetical protein [Bacteroidales bacterium]
MSLAEEIGRIDAQARRKLEKKLPSWAGAGLTVPSSLNLEQCSSEQTALYKAGLIEPGRRVADLTGGLGADSWAFSMRAAAVWYNERDSVLLEAVKCNFEALGVGNAEFCGYHVSQSSDDWKESLKAFGPDVIYLDPARRNSAGRKVFLLEDCSPDVVGLMPDLLALAPLVIVKVSPMADLTMLRRRLEGFLSELHVVGSSGECKEILCLCRRNASFDGIVLAEDGFVFRPDSGSTAPKVPPETSASLHPSHCPLRPAGPSRSHGHGRPWFPETLSASVPTESGLGELLFVPSAAMVKSGLGPGMCLMGYDDELAHFGKYWQLIENLPFASSVLKSLGKRYPQADVTARGVPLSSEQLRAKIKTKPGGSVHIFAIVLKGERRILVCKQML